ncbi:MAG: hypothetical protein AB7N91_10790 [Candidatus Tectimicrobiota bacterium]
MTVIFQLFCVEDLKLLGEQGRQNLLTLIRQHLQPAAPPGSEPRARPTPPQSPFVLGVTNTTTVHWPPQPPATEPEIPPEILTSLRQRFDQILQQLETPMTREPAGTAPTDPTKELLDEFKRQDLARDLSDSAREQILRWALSCEVNHVNFYATLWQIKKAAYELFQEHTGQRPQGPDSLYSPFNPAHPLYSYFENL